MLPWFGARPDGLPRHIPLQGAPRIGQEVTSSFQIPPVALGHISHNPADSLPLSARPHQIRETPSLDGVTIKEPWGTD